MEEEVLACPFDLYLVEVELQVFLEGVVAWPCLVGEEAVLGQKMKDFAILIQNYLEFQEEVAASEYYRVTAEGRKVEPMV